MKISKNTLTVLKNFAEINPNLLFTNSKEIATTSQEDFVIAHAKIDEKIPQFGIYDLNDFLGAMSAIEDPDLAFDASGKYVIIGQNDQFIKYFAASTKILDKFPVREIEFPDPEVKFKLTEANLSTVQKVAAVLKSPDVILIGDKKTLKLVVGDKKNKTANNFELALGKTNKTFEFFIDKKNLKVVPGDYEVSLTSKMATRWVTKDLTYFVAVDDGSTFGD